MREAPRQPGPETPRSRQHRAADPTQQPEDPGGVRRVDPPILPLHRKRHPNGSDAFGARCACGFRKDPAIADVAGMMRISIGA